MCKYFHPRASFDCCTNLCERSFFFLFFFLSFKIWASQCTAVLVCCLSTKSRKSSRHMAALFTSSLLQIAEHKMAGLMVVLLRLWDVDLKRKRKKFVAKQNQKSSEELHRAFLFLFSSSPPPPLFFHFFFFSSLPRFLYSISMVVFPRFCPPLKELSFAGYN